MAEEVDVVIPVRNRPQALERAMESVLRQRGVSWRMVVADNASSDDTVFAAERVAGDRTDVTILRSQENAGPVRNWIRGLRAASADYAMLLFSDDALHEGALAALREGFAGEGVLYVLGRVTVIRENGERLKNVYRIPPGSWSGPDVLREWLGEARGGFHPVSPSGALFRRLELLTALEEYCSGSFPQEALVTGAGPDMWAYLRQHRRPGVVVCAADAGVDYTDTPGNLSRSAYVPAGYVEAGWRFLRESPDVMTSGLARARAAQLYRTLRLRDGALRRRCLSRGTTGGLTLRDWIALPGVICGGPKRWES